ncbi:MAG: oxygen-independent coproporphyrinogen III oxidase [Sphingobium sp.]
MWPYHPELLARPVPRYTSYPTAVEFEDGVGESALREAIDDIAPDQPISLYVHIPFCHEICWYCGCNTGRANRGQRLGAYLDALHAEIHTLARRLEGRGRISRVAFGGGSPNALSPIEFARLVDEMMVAFAADKPTLSVELDPRSLARGWAMALGATGASRVSLGVQTFDPAIQANIGRVQPHAMILEAVRRLRTNGVSSINFDLMYGLPGQTAESLADTLDRTVAMAPERIALFGYAHVPHLLPRQRRIDATLLPDQAQRFVMAATGYERLVAAGYVPVGFDHFALPGDALAQAALNGWLRRNFQGFTEDQSDVLIGLGASAISSFPRAIVQNEKNSGRYRMLATAGRLTGTRGKRRSADDRMRGNIIEDLLCGRAADVARLAGDDALSKSLAPFIDAGLAFLDGGRLSVTANGRPYARVIAALFDSYRLASVKQFSNAV